MQELTERERSILRYIIQQFILTASPVGSRVITKKYKLGFSPATVRNVMSDLEDSGFINHPHTSAGRIPTDKGYRFYVDSLMQTSLLKRAEKENIAKQFENVMNDTDELIQIASKILGSITRQLACVSYPKLESGALQKIQLVRIYSNRILIVISIKSGFVKTITIEITSEIRDSQIEAVQNLLNERLFDLKLSDIRSSLKERLRDADDDVQPVLRVFIDSVDKIFADTRSSDKIFISGASNLMKQPEFENAEKFQSIVELIEDKNIIVHILDKSGASTEQVRVSIGSENDFEELNEYSLVKKEYKIGEVEGTLGVIGPKRMEYDKVVSIVDYLSDMLTFYLKRG